MKGRETSLKPSHWGIIEMFSNYARIQIDRHCVYTAIKGSWAVLLSWYENPALTVLTDRRTCSLLDPRMLHGACGESAVADAPSPMNKQTQVNEAFQATACFCYSRNRLLCLGVIIVISLMRLVSIEECIHTLC